MNRPTIFTIMKRTFYFIACFGFLLLWSSCRKDFEFEPSTGQLEFSKDTVYLDTIFANIGSSTYNLKVYNRSNKDITIPSVSLNRGESSGYRLNVDGTAGKAFYNVEILAKDSLFIFVETTYNTTTNPLINNEFLYTDKIDFDSGANHQSVDLVTLIKDAVFIYPNRDGATGVVETLTFNVNGESIDTDIQGRELLPDELSFTNEKPYVIYGYAAVPNGETLTVNPGARVHFHANSGLIVGENASLKVNGDLSTDPMLLENEVIFEGDRLEPGFSDIPGQWGSIWLFQNSTDNTINYATIKNAGVGLIVDGNPGGPSDKLTLSNTKIYNSSNYGVLARNTSITGENVVINNSGQVSLALTQGGKYNFTHSTIANYWSNSFRQFPALLINNFVMDASNTAFLYELTEANFNNCIVYGNDNPEFLIDEIFDASIDFNFKFTNSLLRFDNSNNNYSGSNYNFNDATHYEGIIFNQSPNFKNVTENDFNINEDSAAKGLGNSFFANQVPLDVSGTDRTASPDSGAYQHTTF